MKDVVKLNRRSGNYRSNWQDTYKEDLALLGYKCEDCGSTKNLDRHHIVHKTKGGLDIPLNLMILCKTCHAHRHKHRIWRR